MSGLEFSAGLYVRNVTSPRHALNPVNGISLELHPEEIVALLGDNFSGATTLAMILAGLKPMADGSIRIEDGDRAIELSNRSPWFHYRSGVIFVPAERPVFGGLSVAENLKLAKATLNIPATDYRVLLETTLAAFPILRTKLSQQADTLSGGERRLLALARAHLASSVRNPGGRLHGFSIVVLEEPTHGLSPGAAAAVSRAIAAWVGPSCSILMIEQNMPFALSLAKRVYELRAGQLVWSGSAAEFEAGHRTSVEQQWT